MNTLKEGLKDTGISQSPVQTDVAKVPNLNAINLNSKGTYQMVSSIWKGCQE